MSISLSNGLTSTLFRSLWFLGEYTPYSPPSHSRFLFNEKASTSCFSVFAITFLKLFNFTASTVTPSVFASLGMASFETSVFYFHRWLSSVLESCQKLSSQNSHSTLKKIVLLFIRRLLLRIGWLLLDTSWLPYRKLAQVSRMLDRVLPYLLWFEWHVAQKYILLLEREL